MPAKTKPSKLPNRTVVADDLAVEVDGAIYYPHAGESVTFRTARQSIDDHLLQLRLVALQKEITVAAEAESIEMGSVVQLEDLIARTFGQLSSAIVAWEWTGDDGAALPLEIATLRSLSREELDWLRSHAFPEPAEAERGNGSAPSA